MELARPLGVGKLAFEYPCDKDLVQLLEAQKGQKSTERAGLYILRPRSKASLLSCILGIVHRPQKPSRAATGGLEPGHPHRHMYVLRYLVSWRRVIGCIGHVVSVNLLHLEAGPTKTRTPRPFLEDLKLASLGQDGGCVTLERDLEYNLGLRRCPVFKETWILTARNGSADHHSSWITKRTMSK